MWQMCGKCLMAFNMLNEKHVQELNAHNCEVENAE